MPVVIQIVALEDSNLVRDALTNPTPDAAIASAFQYVERGDLGGRSRTPLNGGWSGALSVARRPDGTAEAQRTWTLTDAQAAASGLSTDAAVRAFALRLADDVHASLRERASRNRGGQLGDFWTVGASAGRTTAPGTTPAPIPPGPVAPIPPVVPPSSHAGWWALGLAGAAGLAAWAWSKR